MEEILLAELDRLGQDDGLGVHIVEVGSIRTDDPVAGESDGWSTLTFARHVAENGGSLVSIDLDVSAAKRVVEGHGLTKFVSFKKGSGQDVLATLVTESRFVDLVFLDGGGDPDMNLKEFVSAMSLVREGGTIIVDDASEDPEAGACKAHAIIPYLAHRGMSYEIVERTSSTYTTGMLVVRSVG